MDKKILASLILIGLLGAAAGIGTYAYFSSTKTMNPVFNTANLNLNVGIDYPWKSVLSNMEPGKDYVQVFRLTNAGTASSSYSELQISYKGAPTITDDNTNFGSRDNEVVAFPISLTLNTLFAGRGLEYTYTVLVGGTFNGASPIIAVLDLSDGRHIVLFPGWEERSTGTLYTLQYSETVARVTPYTTNQAVDFVIYDATWTKTWSSVSVGYGPFSAVRANDILSGNEVATRIAIQHQGANTGEKDALNALTIGGTPKPLPDIGEVIWVTVVDQEGTTASNYLKNWADYKMKILDASGGVGWVTVTLHFMESAGNEYQNICGEIKFTFTLWQGP